MICMMTVSRNATNDFRTKSARLAYGNFLFSRGGEILNPHISETAKDSPINTILKTVRNRLGNLIKVVWKLYKAVKRS